MGKRIEKPDLLNHEHVARDEYAPSAAELKHACPDCRRKELEAGK